MNYPLVNAAIAVFSAVCTVIWILISLQMKDLLNTAKLEILGKVGNVVSEFRAHEATDEARHDEILRTFARLEER